MNTVTIAYIDFELNSRNDSVIHTEVEHVVDVPSLGAAEGYVQSIFAQGFLRVDWPKHGSEDETLIEYIPVHRILMITIKESE